jgi:purine-binding chemotaxis protein CheW
MSMSTEILERPAVELGAVPISELAARTGQVEDSNIRQFVTFIAGDEVFAVDMAPVQEIIRVPEVVRVPLAPPALEGLANLRGRVLPIISLRRTFGFAERAPDDASRAVVIDLGQPLGFVVDRVASVVGVDPTRIEGVESIRGTVKADLLCGMLKDVGGHAMIMVLDFAKLIAAEFSEITALSESSGAAVASGIASDTLAVEAASHELQLVSFMVAGQEYAIAIEDVQEIVHVPDTVVHVPNADAHVLGLMTLRNRLLPLVSLRTMFGLPPQNPDDRSRIVVVSLDGHSVGVVMDRVNEVLRVAKADVDAMPGLFAADQEMADISGICRLEGGKRLVSILSASKMFRLNVVKEALDAVSQLEAAGDSAGMQEELLDDEEQVVVFRLDREEFGVPIASVQEIVRVPELLTHVPKAPAFVEGVINLRGTVLPVIDQRRRLGLVATERSDRQRIMVFLLGGARTGFIVDSVTEVLKIPLAAIETAPRLSGEQVRLIGRVANLTAQKRLIQLIEPARLVEGEDLQGLAALSS